MEYSLIYTKKQLPKIGDTIVTQDYDRCDFGWHDFKKVAVTVLSKPRKTNYNDSDNCFTAWVNFSGSLERILFWFAEQGPCIHGIGGDWEEKVSSLKTIDTAVRKYNLLPRYSDDTTLTSKKLWQIAEIISDHWKKVNYTAKPYLAAMRTLNTINDMYGSDDGRNIVVYFLANATTWKGGIARKVKKHLNSLINN